MARLAIRFGCNGIRRLSARRSVPGARQRTRSYHSSSNRLTPFQRVIPWLAIISGGLYWYDKRQPSTSSNEWNEALRQHMEGKGVNREICEAKIAEIKQKIEAGSTSESERYVLHMYEEWLQVLTRGST